MFCGVAGRDMSLLLGTVLASALFVFTGNLIADILYYVIDPRMKEGGLLDERK